MSEAIDRSVRAIFDKAIYLIDEQNESTGETRTADTKEYEVRTIGILNNLVDLVSTVSDTYRLGENGKRPALPDLKTFEDTVELDAFCVRDLLPLGLAAKLMSEENPDLANYFQMLFEEHMERAKNLLPAGGFEDIDGDIGGPYGGIEHGKFAFWQ